MYRIMYKAEGMRRFESAVALNDAQTELVEARFSSKEVAEEYRRRWFEEQEIARECGAVSRVERVRPSTCCEYVLVT